MGYSEFQATFNEEVYAFRPPLTVILDKPWNEQTTACQEALHKLLERVQQSLESVRLVHQSTLDLSVWGADPPARIVAFVNPPKGIAMNEKISTPTSEIVVTEPLSVLLSNDEVKRKFWSAFKTLFPS